MRLLAMTLASIVGSLGAGFCDEADVRAVIDKMKGAYLADGERVGIVRLAVSSDVCFDAILSGLRDRHETVYRRNAMLILPLLCASGRDSKKIVDALSTIVVSNEEHWTDRCNALSALAQTGEDSVHLIIGSLVVSEDIDIRNGALDALLKLGRISDAAMRKVEQHYRCPNKMTRLTSVRIMSKLHGQTNAMAAMRYFRDPCLEVASEALNCIVTFRDAVHPGLLVWLFNSRNDVVTRLAIVDISGKLQYVQRVEFLLGIVAEYGAKFRYNCAGERDFVCVYAGLSIIHAVSERIAYASFPR